MMMLAGLGSQKNCPLLTGGSLHQLPSDVDGHCPEDPHFSSEATMNASLFHGPGTHRVHAFITSATTIEA